MIARKRTRDSRVSTAKRDPQLFYFRARLGQIGRGRENIKLHAVEHSNLNDG